MNTSIQQINNTNFGKIITGVNAKRKICSQNCPKRIINVFISNRKAIRKSGINKLNKFDVILDYSERIGYFLQICTKQGDADHRTNSIFENIVNTEECINKIREWGKQWNKKFLF